MAYLPPSRIAKVSESPALNPASRKRQPRAEPYKSSTAAPFPPVEDVVVRAEMEKAEIAVGEPVVVRLVYENKGTATYWVEEDHLGDQLMPYSITLEAAPSVAPLHLR